MEPVTLIAILLGVALISGTFAVYQQAMIYRSYVAELQDTINLKDAVITQLRSCGRTEQDAEIIAQLRNRLALLEAKSHPPKKHIREVYKDMINRVKEAHADDN